MTLASCSPCARYTRHLGPYFLPKTDATLYAHYQCNACGRVKISEGKNIKGETVSLQYVQPWKVRK